MGASETVEVTGHLMDSGILSRILDDIRDYGGDYSIDTFDVGHEAHDLSTNSGAADFVELDLARQRDARLGSVRAQVNFDVGTRREAA